MEGAVCVKYLILAINPGSTSTKIALYENEKELFKDNIEHPQGELERYKNIVDQLPMRRDVILTALQKHGYQPKDLSIVMGRGGLLPPIRTGGYRVNKKMLDVILKGEIQSHASNLGAVLANEIAEKAGVKAYIYDAVSAGELSEVAEMTDAVAPARGRHGIHHRLRPDDLSCAESPAAAGARRRCRRSR